MSKAYRPLGLAAPGRRVVPIAPSADLSGRIATYFSVELDADAPELSVRTLPDGCVDLVFDLGASPRGYVGGLRQQAEVYARRGPSRLLGVQFLPGAARALLGLPLDLLSGDWTPLDELLETSARDLAEELAEADTGERLARLEAFLRTRLARKPADRRVVFALRRLFETGGALAIPALGMEVGASPRNLTRLFRDHVGTGPKRLARIIRFQSILNLRTAPRWADLAVELGYADQSHLVREFATFAGLSPTRLAAA